jgi:hypothetical protein
MTRTDENGARFEAKANWSVVVVYEDAAARERAVCFCDQLVSRFWPQCDFNVSWWPFAMLERADSAREAAEKAVRGDVIVFATTQEGDFPRAIKSWIETWLHQRGDREGMLVALFEPSEGVGSREGQKHHCLRNVAHHGAMDYLTQVPQDLSRSIPDSLDSFTQRADQVTSLLEGILRQQAPPPHLVS